MKAKRIIIADDHLLFLKGMEELMNKIPKIELLAVLEDGNLVVKEVQRLKPELLLLDLNFKTIDGFTILKKLNKLETRPLVVFVTMYNDPAIVNKARDMGANGFFVKETDPMLLINVLLSLKENDFKTSEFMSLTNKQTTQNLTPGLFPDSFESSTILTSRELEILKLIAAGNSAKIIAEILYISSHTVDTHRKNMLKKLGLNKISDLVKYAVTQKLI
jgi:DNA-binding NarL/FixJ family response regulator